MELLRCLLITPLLLLLWKPAERWVWADDLGSWLIEWAEAKR